MHILFIGDIVGKPGREILRRALPHLVEQHAIDLVVANVENAAGGMGVTRDVAESIRDCGVDVMTSGNHIWDKKEALEYIQPRAPPHPTGKLPGRAGTWSRGRPDCRWYLGRRHQRHGPGLHEPVGQSLRSR